MPTARAGWTADTLANLADGPAAFVEMLDQVDSEIGVPSVANVAGLPASGNFDGRMRWVRSTEIMYRYHITLGWRPVSGTRSEVGAASHAYGGGVGPVTTTVTYATPFTTPPSIALSCNDPRFDLYFGSASTAGFTLFSKAQTAGITLSLALSWTATGPAA